MDHLSESEIREILRVFARRLTAPKIDALLVEEVAVDGGRNRIDMLTSAIQRSASKLKAQAMILADCLHRLRRLTNTSSS